MRSIFFESLKPNNPHLYKHISIAALMQLSKYVQHVSDVAKIGQTFHFVPSVRDGGCVGGLFIAHLLLP